MVTFQSYWWRKTSGAPTYIISGTSRHFVEPQTFRKLAGLLLFTKKLKILNEVSSNQILFDIKLFWPCW